jgi:hypothetical protein
MKIDYSKRFEREGVDPGRPTLKRPARDTGGRSFRELMREARLERAFKRLKGHTDKALFVYKEYCRQAGDKDPKEDSTSKERMAILGGFYLEHNLSRLLPLIAGSTGDIDALWDVMEYAFILGTVAGPFASQRREQTKKARDERVPWWHSEALTRAAKMQDYPEKLTAVATRIYNQLKDRTDGPPSWDAVRAVFRRDRAKKRRKPK